MTAKLTSETHGFLLTMVDISEQRAVERQLRHQEEFQRNLLMPPKNVVYIVFEAVL